MSVSTMHPASDHIKFGLERKDSIALVPGRPRLFQSRVGSSNNSGNTNIKDKHEFPLTNTTSSARPDTAMRRPRATADASPRLPSRGGGMMSRFSSSRMVTGEMGGSSAACRADSPTMLVEGPLSNPLFRSGVSPKKSKESILTLKRASNGPSTNQYQGPLSSSSKSDHYTPGNSPTRGVSRRDSQDSLTRSIKKGLSSSLAMVHSTDLLHAVSDHVSPGNGVKRGVSRRQSMGAVPPSSRGVSKRDSTDSLWRHSNTGPVSRGLSRLSSSHYVQGGGANGGQAPLTGSSGHGGGGLKRTIARHTTDVTRGVSRHASTESIPAMIRTAPKKVYPQVYDYPQVSTLHRHEVVVGKLLGSGSFSNVHHIKALENKDGALYSMHARFCLKALHEKARNDPEMLATAENDLLNEAVILSCLPKHDNIINFVALSTGFWDSPASGFIVMDKLVETLDKRIKKWKLQSSSYQQHPQALIEDLDEHTRALVHRDQRDRIADAGIGLARGLAFLHDQGVLYRDLKPKNVGFDSDGNVRLFDFGIAVQLEELEESSDDQRLMTLCAGTPRYMAPEVFTEQDYSYPADVYSFAIMLWQIVSLQVPYPHIKRLDELQTEVTEGYRPTVRLLASERLGRICKAAWHPSVQKRPTMQKLVKILEREVAHNRRASLRD